MTRPANAAGTERTTPTEALPDARPDHPIWRYAPPGFRPYIQLARLDRPIGWWLLLLPCWWSSALATSSLGLAPNLLHFLLLLIGAVAMRGAGSTYNDLVDRDIDARVERTRNRPLASRRLRPRQALVFLVLECLVGLAVLLCFNWFAIGVGLSSLVFVVIYPFMKRTTSWPQAALGLAFAWGGLMGWAAIMGSLAWPAFLIYAAAILWTIGYDTIYALQDIRDDSIIGVRSTARLFGASVRPAVAMLFAGAILLTEAALLTARVGPLAQLGLLAFAAHLMWQVRAIDPDDQRKALLLFRSNRDAGLLLFAGIALDGLVARIV
ncbi:MAG: 4-hydroxybenzoate octaprenyltransferase [Methylobacteriaceae bacterium]|nr:4-hydroxybenzoate octaprenyltransferase [Methylobacteriaceae bacterium]